MKSKLLVFSFPLFFLFFLLFLSGCTKIDTTTIGAGILPVVDNINTFEEDLDVITKNYTDTTSNSVFIFRTDYHALGKINDPIFGNTEARVFFRLGLPYSKFSYPATKDKLTLDSAVLVIKYSAYYGDSTAPQQFNVYQVNDVNFVDTAIFRINNNFTYNPTLLGSAQVAPVDVHATRDLTYRKDKDSTVSDQLRIRLSDNFGRDLLDQDSTGAFLSDSAFREYLRGLAIVPDASAPGNSLMYFQISTDTRIMLYYKAQLTDKTIDTVQAFTYNASTCANANYITRDRSVGSVSGHLDNDLADDAIYLQGTPGTRSLVSIPGLESLSNRIVHRADLIIKQIWEGPQKIEEDLYPSPYVYPQIFNTDSGKVIDEPPFDTLIHNTALGGIYTSDFFYYVGGISKYQLDNAGHTIATYLINLTRPVQAVITRRFKNYPIQLTIPYRPARFAYYNPTMQPYTLLGEGRLKAGGGGHPQYKMYLRIIYSKIQ